MTPRHQVEPKLPLSEILEIVLFGLGALLLAATATGTGLLRVAIL